MDLLESPPNRTKVTSGEFDLVVVGGGIVGLATAREMSLRHPGSSICVLEKEPEIGSHQTGHNSGVIHAGVYYAAGSLKAKLCRSGKEKLERFCAEREIRFKRPGKLIVATEWSEIGRLDQLESRARANEVPGLVRLDAAGISEFEPHASGVAALHSPETGVVDFRAVAHALSDDLTSRGHLVATDHEVIRIVPGTRPTVVHRNGTLRASTVLCCAGAWSDRLAQASGASPDPRIVPFRGSYLEVKTERRDLVRGMIYPVPDPDLPFLGVHLTRHIDGSLTIGPTAMMAGSPDPDQNLPGRLKDLLHTLSWPGTRRMAWRNRRSAKQEITLAAFRRRLVEEARRFVPELSVDDVMPGMSGIRAQAVTRDGQLADDFIFDRTGKVLHVRNAPSPAATSSLAIADYLADSLEDLD